MLRRVRRRVRKARSKYILVSYRDAQVIVRFACLYYCDYDHEVLFISTCYQPGARVYGLVLYAPNDAQIENTAGVGVFDVFA